MTSMPFSALPDITNPAYRDAYSRINGMVVVGENLACRHFRLLARAIPNDQQELERLAAMEGRHASDFMGCGRNLGIKPDLGLARLLFAPLHELFLRCNQQGDLPGCLVIQGLIVECFALSAYHAYLPVADAYAQPITTAVISDEGEHLGYAERWLHAHFGAAQASAGMVSRKALPITLAILQTMAKDMKAIGMDPHEVLANFSELFLQALKASGFDQTAARRIVTGGLAAAATR